MSDSIDETLLLALGDFERTLTLTPTLNNELFTIQKEQTTTSFLLALSK